MWLPQEPQTTSPRSGYGRLPLREDNARFWSSRRCAACQTSAPTMAGTATGMAWERSVRLVDGRMVPRCLVGRAGSTALVASW